MSVANKKKSECCGCNACVEICPKHCIEMVADSKGFFYPKVNVGVCIECGACDKVCPFVGGNVKLQFPRQAFAAWNKNREQYLSSSSGGAAYVFSSYILNSGGVVYGCAADGMQIRHIRVDKLSDLSKLQGSKYVQSGVRGLYAQVKSDLNLNLPVLFIGTPCQVAGLKNYVKHIPEHLYLVDLICHGVPSQQMLREHINHCIGGAKPVNHISFRKGSEYLLILSGDGFSHSASVWRDMYYRGFMQGITYRASCYNCPFAQPDRVGDITIGDFWGLQYADSFPTKEGVSVLLPCTGKGLRLIDAVRTQMEIHERPIDEAVKGNPQLQKPMESTFKSKLFGILYPMVSLDTLMRMLIFNQKIGTAIRLWKAKYGVGK